MTHSRLNTQTDVVNYSVLCHVLSNSNKMPGTEPKFGHDQLPNFPYKAVFTSHPIIQRYITSVADVVPARTQRLQT